MQSLDNHCVYLKIYIAFKQTNRTLNIYNPHDYKKDIFITAQKQNNNALLIFV
jgi:hypothetical protein